MSAASGPLAGRRIAVTRPRDQAGPLARAIEAAGGLARVFPLLEISPPGDTLALQTAAQDLPSYDLVIFVSPNAASYALPTLLAHGAWPESLPAAAIGESTAQSLVGAAIGKLLVPQEQYDSEALLALPALEASAIHGRRVLLLRGDGGRPLLLEELRARGARVDPVCCYRRSGSADGLAALQAEWRDLGLDALAVSSSEALRFLTDGLAPELRERFRQVPLFVPHQRIADTAKAAGLQQVVLTKPADAGILAGLCAYNWPRS